MGIHEIIGWVGALLFIIAYFLLSIRKLKPDKLPYQLLNILTDIRTIGGPDDAAGIIVSSFPSDHYGVVATYLLED